MRISLGDSKTLILPLRWQGAQFSPGSDWGLIFTAKADPADADSDALIQKATGAGITVSGNKASVAFVPADTVALEPAIAHCDIQAQNISTGAVRTVWEDTIELRRDITRETETSVPIYTTEPPYPGGDLTSGPVRSSGGTSSIANNALSIGMVSGLRGELDTIPSITRTAAQGSPIDATVVFVGGDYDGTTIAKSSTPYNGRMLFSTGIFRVEWDNIRWRFLANGVVVYNAVGDTSHPSDADWQGGTISLAKRDLTAPYIGATCRVGDSAPYDWYLAETLTAWRGPLQLDEVSTAWGDITGKPSTFAPTAHKSSHATGGSDALTPADIGAMVNSNTALNAAIATSPRATRNALQLTKPRTVAFFGDSITDQDSGIPVSPYAQTNGRGYPSWAQFILKGRFTSLPQTVGISKANFGVSGATVNTLRGVTDQTSETVRSQDAVMASNSQLAHLIARATQTDSIVCELSGANDLAAGYTAANIAAKRAAMWQEMIASGIPASRIVVVATLPHLNSTNTAIADAANTIAAASAASLGVTWVDYPASFKSAGSPVANRYGGDLIHPNKIGAQELGGAVATALSPLVADDTFPVSTTWLTTNPYATGTQAVSGTGYTGSIATGWNIIFNDTSGNSTTYSKVTDAEGEWQRQVTTGSARSSSPTIRIPVPTIPANRQFRMVMRARGSGFWMIDFKLVVNSSAAAYVLGPGSDDVPVNPLNLNAFDGLLVSPVMIWPGGERIAEIFVTGAGIGTLDFRQIGIIVVPNEPINAVDLGQTIVSMVQTGTPTTVHNALIPCNATAGAINVNLPSPGGVIGRRQTYIKTDSSGNAVTLIGTINWGTNHALPSQGSKVTIVATPDRWLIVE